MTEIAVQFSGVSKSYQSSRALDRVDLAVRKGELFGILGENGAGKTTLIKCLLDFCEIDDGNVKIFGVPGELVKARSVLAYLPERFNPPYYLTGADFLRYMARLHGCAYDEFRVLETLARLDFDAAALSRPARSYSKGMAQKLAFAACLLSGKQLYVLDEPASGLDPKARSRLKHELRTLRAAGNTVFFATHDLAEAEELCNRIAVLHAGRVRYTGTPGELMRQYGARSMEVAFLACIEDKPAALHD